MKLSYEEALILARIFERYVSEAEKYILANFNGHIEYPKNRNLLVELVEDTSLLRKIYPFLNQGSSLNDSIEERFKKFGSKETKVTPPRKYKTVLIDDVSELGSNFDTRVPTEEEFAPLLRSIDNK